MAVQALLTLLLVVPMGPQLYRLFYQPIAAASTLVLLIVSIAVHLALVGLGLLAFGAEGARTAPFSDAGLTLGPVNVNSQALWVVAVSALLIVVLYQFFERSMYGKALRAAAFNAGRAPDGYLAGVRRPRHLLPGGADRHGVGHPDRAHHHHVFRLRLHGQPEGLRRRHHRRTGQLSAGAAGAVLVGLIEAFSSFWASAYKEIVVFTLIIPVLLWRSLKSHHVEEEEE